MYSHVNQCNREGAKDAKKRAMLIFILRVCLRALRAFAVNRRFLSSQQCNDKVTTES